MNGRAKRLVGRTAAAAVIASLCALGALEYVIRTTELPSFDAPQSVSVMDKEGEVLRVFVASDGRWRLPVSAQMVDQGYLTQLIAYEDKRFYSHPGVDPVAMIRAAFQSLLAGEIRSGGSTLTMQVARLLEQGSTGRWSGKLRQMRVALALERQLSKTEILELYLNRAPMGGNLEGVRAAAFSYFNKDANRLSPSQAALLVALPQSPETRRPDRNPDIARSARDRVLQRSQRKHAITSEDLYVALEAQAPDKRLPFPALAPHLADRLVADDPEARFHHSTLDARLQKALEAMLRRYVENKDPRLSAAIVVIDHKTGELRASVGGPDYLDETRAGFFDMTRAVRSPGSTLKPIIYALAFEDGLAHPQSHVQDRETQFGDYTPQNFDKTYRGTVTLAKALQLSLNVPAVALLDRVGTAKLLARMQRIGVKARTQGNRRPGLALALGGAGVTLEELTRLYGALGNRGLDAGFVMRKGDFNTASQRLTEAVPAWYVADILRQAPRPPTVKGAEIAFKTGTSYGHRDAWAIGFDGTHAVGIWLGRADAASMPGILGIDAAAPLLFDAFTRISPKADPIFAAPANALTVSHTQLPQPLREFGAGRNVARTDSEVQISFPPTGSRIDLNGGREALVVKLKNARKPVTWLIDGRVVANNPFAESLTWFPQGVGFLDVSVIDSSGNSARTELFIE